MIFYKRDYLIFGLFLLLCVLGLIRTVISVGYSTHGVEIAKVQEQIAKLRTENAELQVKILEESSFQTILKKAEAMGFEVAANEDYIVLR